MALGSRTTSSVVPPGIEIIVIGYLVPLDLATACHSCDKADKSGKHGWVDVLTLDVAGKIREGEKEAIQCLVWFSSCGKVPNSYTRDSIFDSCLLCTITQQAPSI